MTSPVRPVPECVTFDGGLMRFEQLATVEFEDRSLLPPRSLHIGRGKEIAERYGYRFSGEGKVDRIQTTDPGVMLYRLTVPGVPGRRGSAVSQEAASGAMCVCGHIEAHHESPVNMIGPMFTLPKERCEWAGCGCPRFVGHFIRPERD